MKGCIVLSSNTLPPEERINHLWFPSRASTYPRKMKDYQTFGCLRESQRSSQHNTSFCKLADPGVIIRNCRLRVRRQSGRASRLVKLSSLVWPLRRMIDGPSPPPSSLLFFLCFASQLLASRLESFLSD